MKRSLPEIALGRPVTVVMLLVTLLGLGAIAYQRITLEFIPRLDVPFIGCFIPYPGATPEQVENEIAIPAEGVFQTIPRIRRITTTSNSDGCFVRISFDWEADMAVAASEVRDRMERLKLKLPSSVDRMFLQRFASTSLPVMMFPVFREGGEEDLAYTVRTYMQPRLLRLDGVADVEVFGQPEREILIEFDQSALRSRNLGLYDVVGRLQQSSFNLTAGTLEDGGARYFVRVTGEFDSPEALAELVVGPNNLRLNEVAEVGYQQRDTDSDFTVDGQGGAVVAVRKEAEANTVDVCAAVREELERLKDDPLLGELQTVIMFDQSQIILSALDGLMNAGKYGGGLAFAVLFLFLRRLRPTLLVALAIPSSLVAGLVFMFFSGMSLNLVTMSSMIIAVGLLVDNSIVVMENIYRHNQLGHPPEESARRGASEVAMAITAATITTTVVFIPILYMESGRMAVYMRQFGAPVSVSLFTSLLIALTVIPLFASRMRPLTEHPLAQRFAWLGATAPARAAAGTAAVLARFRLLSRLISGYRASLGAALRWRFAVVLGIACVIAITAVQARTLQLQNEPAADTRQVHINVRFTQALDMESARQRFAELKKFIDAHRDELEIKNVFASYRPTGGQFQVFLRSLEDFPPGKSPKYTTEEVETILWQKLPQRLPGTEIHLRVAVAGESDEQGVTVRLRGDDIRTLETYADQFAAQVARIPGIIEAETDLERAREEIQLSVDHAMARQAGVTPMVVAQTVDFALRGIRLPYIKAEEREVPVWAQFREEDRRTRGNLDNVAVVSAQGGLVPLGQLVEYQRGFSPNAITRIDGKNVITVSATTRTEDLARIQRDLRALAARFDLPLGYSIEMGDELVELEQTLINFYTALLLAVVLIYLVMGALFESFVLPLSILTTVPLAGLGVVWAMLLTNTPVDMIAFIGMILLAGIIVNNGIVIVDYINQLRRRGFDRYDAILQAGHDRFRPVMMTALTTILGCVPLAIGGGVGGQVAFNSLGRALIGGLTAGTLLTLFIVPVFYTLIDDARSWFMQYLGNLASIGKGRGQAMTPAPGK